MSHERHLSLHGKCLVKYLDTTKWPECQERSISTFLFQMYYFTSFLLHGFETMVRKFYYKQKHIAIFIFLGELSLLSIFPYH